MARGARTAQAVKGDAISIVEAAYDLTGDTRAWLARLLEAAAPKLDRGRGAGIALFDSQRAFIDPATAVTRGIEPAVLAKMIELEASERDAVKSLSGQPMQLVTSSQAIGLTPAQTRAHPPFADLHALGVYDFLGAFTMTPTRWWVEFVAPMPDTSRPSRGECAMWSRVLAHVAAGARMRDAFASATCADVMAGAEAIVTPAGAVQHAEMPAQSADARDSLRDAAKAIDRARSQARANDDEALELWQGLVFGRWSLIDRFDSDGRRFLVARRNDPEVPDPRALSLRERQVLAYAAMGHPLKNIAYALGLSGSTVSLLRKRGMRKLGLSTQAELALLFAPAK
jgi:DNA-binding CsgD family transcriptional regulator